VPEYLVEFMYHEPESLDLWNRGIIWDFESTEILWITADLPAEAIAWGNRVAEAFHRHVNDLPNADWDSEYRCWIVESPSMIPSSYLDFCQRVQIGEMPSFDEMGSEAYRRWLEDYPQATGICDQWAPSGFRSIYARVIDHILKCIAWIRR